MIIDSLAKNGIVKVGELHEQPFISRAPQGPDTYSTGSKIDVIADVLT